jgi:1,4-dihydroxy-2-naphthoyl-CoA hydrolase
MNKLPTPDDSTNELQFPGEDSCHTGVAVPTFRPWTSARHLLIPHPHQPTQDERSCVMNSTDKSHETTPDLSLDKSSAFVTAAGLHIVEARGDRVSGWIDLGSDHHTPWGIVHGGVYLTAVESAASIGASAAVADRGLIAVGVHNATDFIRGAKEGRAEVVAVPIQQGNVQQLWEVTISRAADGQVLAQGRLRLQNVEPRA